MRFPHILATSPILLIVGCAALSPKASTPQLTDEESAAVIADCTTLLSTQFPPAQTVLYFKSSSPGFEKAFAQALRDRGFAVAAQPTANAQPLAYNLTALDEQTLLLRLAVAKSWGANRLYQRSPDRDQLAADTVFAIRTNAKNPPTLLQREPLVGATGDEVGLTSLPEQSEKSPPQAEPSSTSPDVAPAAATPVAPADTAAPSPILTARVEQPELEPTAEPEAPLAPPAREIVVTKPAASKYSVREPNADNEIVLDAQLFDRPSEAGNNPFVQLYQPPKPLRELRVVVSAGIRGPNPTAIVNGKLYNKGAAFEGMEVHEIDDQNVWLLRKPFLLRCPIGSEALTLRVP